MVAVRSSPLVVLCPWSWVPRGVRVAVGVMGAAVEAETVVVDEVVVDL